jgi:hypothetical protein
MEATPTFAPTDVADELFSDDFDTAWLVKGERTPTAAVAIETVIKYLGYDDDGLTASARRARIEWRDAEGWWLTVDPKGEYEVWEVAP